MSDQPTLHWSRSTLAPIAEDGFRRVAASSDRMRAVTLSFEPGRHVAEHMHRESDELYHVISGTARVLIEGATFVASSGDLLVIPSGARHAIAVDVAAAEPFVILAVVAPNRNDAVVSSNPLPFPPQT